METSWIAALVAPLLARNLGLPEFRAARLDEPPSFLPLYPAEAGSVAAAVAPKDVPSSARGAPGFRFRRIREYQSAYESGSVTPEEVAERALAAMAASDRPSKPMRAFVASYRDDVLTQARESARRHKEGRVLGPLDGVPVAVKDEVDMVPYPTSAGTRFLGNTGARSDATVVHRLRSAGALLIGKTNMHEIGILPNALNAHYGPVRNPYHPDREAGGSSSGSSAAVAAGLCPAAIGADGGGSIRIPSAYCGLVGLKPTFGRVSEHGAVPLAWSVAHLGPIAATAEDAALLYAAIAGPDPLDPNTQCQPPARIGEYTGSLTGLRIGVYRAWFADATKEIVAACDQLLEQFGRLGAEVVDVLLPDLSLIAVAHGLTIHTEMAANMARYDREHRRDFSLTTRLMLANARTMRSVDYVQAQCVRTRAIAHFRVALAGADVIATPTTPTTASAISKHGLTDSESDIGKVMEVMRFINPANLTGLPAISIPSGYDDSGLPVGLQLIGRPWDESTLFRFAYAAESIIEKKKPAVYFDLLDDGRDQHSETNLGSSSTPGPGRG